MDPKEIAKLVAVLESRRVAVGVVGAFAITAGTAIMAHNAVLAAAAVRR